MKSLKAALFVVLAYVGIVFLFESSLGYLQPQGARTPYCCRCKTPLGRSVIVYSRHYELNGALYVAVNHWPRQWYKITGIPQCDCGVSR